MFAWKTDKIEKYRSKGRIAAALIASAVGGALTGVCSLTIATGSQPRAMFDSYFTNPWILALNLAVPVVLALFFTLLTNRAWIAWLLTNLVVMLPTVVSFFKVEFRGDPLCAEDLTLVTESKKMLETYKLFWDDRFGFYLAILARRHAGARAFLRGRFRRAAPAPHRRACVGDRLCRRVPALHKRRDLRREDIQHRVHQPLFRERSVHLQGLCLPLPPHDQGRIPPRARRL